MSTSKVSLHEYLRDNERIILIFGVFIALLPLSFDTLNKVNPIYAAAMGIASSLIIVLLIKSLTIKEEKDASLEVTIFYLSLIAIGIVVALTTFQMFPTVTISFLDSMAHLAYLVLGAVLTAKLIIKLDKIKGKRLEFLINLILVSSAITVLSVLKGYFNLPIEEILIKLNLTFGRLLTIEYEETFLAGVSFLIVIKGLISAYEYFIKKQIYGRLIKHSLLKKNKH